MKAHSKIAPFIENAAESTAACLITMVNGNVFLLTLSHWLIATQTGVIAGLVTVTTILLAHVRQSWANSVLLGVVTMCVDFLVHSGQLVPVIFDSVVTGVGATLISLAVGRLITWWRSLRVKYPRVADIFSTSSSGGSQEADG